MDSPVRPGGSDGPQRRPRVGHLDFLNSLPLYWGLGRNGALIDLDITADTPDRLSAALTDGRLDVGPISLVEFLRHQDDLVALPEPAIGSDGPVMSCLIVSRGPLKELDGRTVALSTTSRTSILLAELLLDRCVGVSPVFRPASGSAGAMLEGADAAVLIGDAALHASLHEAPRLGLRVHDLGAMWKDWTGLPFVFALFAARRSYLAAEPDAVENVHRALVRGRDVGLREIDRICAHAARWTPYPPDFLHRYFTRALDYTLGSAQLAGIAEFARLAGGARAGFAPDTTVTVLAHASVSPGGPAGRPTTEPEEPR